MFYSIVIDTTDFLDRQKKRSATEILQKHFFFIAKNKAKQKQNQTNKYKKNAKREKGQKYLAIFQHYERKG